LANIITVSDITSSFPEFATYSPTLIQQAIDDAKLFINQKVWGPKYLVGWKYFAAHLLKSGKINSLNGPVIREKVGDLETGYANIPYLQNNHSTTPYGRIFDQLVATLLTTMIGTGC
jgi:Protein of unknown function (DUF4054)